MSMQAINYALTLPVEESGPRLTLILIAHHIHWQTGCMFVSQEELAREVKCNVRSIRRYLDYLCEMEIISREEQRSPDGRRSSDQITLIGYLEWQDIIQNGGVIRDPKTRGKQQDKLSGGQEPTGQPVSSQPDKSCEPTGQQVSGIKQTIINLKTNPSSETSNLDLKAKGAKPALVVERSDSQFAAWMAELRNRGLFDLAERHEAAGEITVTSRWPSTTSEVLSNPKPVKLSERSKAMTGGR